MRAYNEFKMNMFFYYYVHLCAGGIVVVRKNAFLKLFFTHYV